MKTQQQIAPLCSFATSNELGVHFRVSVTVHSNRQSSLHPPPSGASFVNAQSPPRQNYRARRISYSFPRLATKRSFLAVINLILYAVIMIFSRYSRRLNKNLYVYYFAFKSFKENTNCKNIIFWKNSFIFLVLYLLFFKHARFIN